MDKNKLKTFAIESRRQLINDTIYQANLLGITKDGIQDPVEEVNGMQAFDIGGNKPYVIYDEDIEKRNNLIKEIQDKGFDNVIEEVAYTWFNRIIAIRYMEVNDYLPTRIRVLSSDTLGKNEPDIIRESPDIELNLTNDDQELINELKEKNELNELFRFLFIKQCNKLNEILPGLFEKTSDYMELLLNISFTNSEDVIHNLINNISEEDFKEQVEIVGWLYQFYNIELKEDTYKNIVKNKIPKSKIPATTQLFTPDWIVRYMVENSLGKLWLEGHHDSNLKNDWKYYIDETFQEQDILNELNCLEKQSEILRPEDITIIDPSMGSGHILVYVFDILMQIYSSLGYSKKDASLCILKNNIFGLDIDDRAYQLAYFAIMMKARSYNKKIFNLNVNPLVFSIKESNSLDNNFIEFIFNEYPEIKNDFEYLINTFQDAKEYGSTIKVDIIDFTGIKNMIYDIENKFYHDIKLIKFRNQIKIVKNIIYQAELLSQKYNLVITNPPYMGSNNMNSNLKAYIKSNYPLSKSDLYSVFIERGLEMVDDNMFNCMVTMQSWMFLSSFEKFRKDLLNKSVITNLLHMDNNVMGIAFGTSATVFRKRKMPKFNGTYNHIQLKNINNNAPYEFPVPENRNNSISIEQLNKIPGSPIAYWVDPRIRDLFIDKNQLKNYVTLKSGKSSSGKNNYFFKLWYEVNYNDIQFDCESSISCNRNFVPMNKGGSYRRWYGNKEYVSLIEFASTDKQEFEKAITWSDVNNSYFSARLHEKGIIANNVGKRAYVSDYLFYYILGLLNCKISDYVLDLIIPTIHFDVGYVGKLPLIVNNEKIDEINSLVKENINISKKDWDNFEKSWDFKTHPIIELYKLNKNDNCKLSELYEKWDNILILRHKKLQENEEKLNEIFLKTYNIEDLFTSHVNEKLITISETDIKRDVKSLISYAVGCMLGRYSLDSNGIIFAGGEFNLNNYSNFIPDEDNIIPILDTAYFDDDVVGQFVEFVKVCFGEENLEENLDFIAGVLKNKGNSNRETIRNYFLNEFFDNHFSIYKSRTDKLPIYWLFDSGKENGFKCLVYMHRYSPDLVARLRTDYLHKTQKAIESQISYQQNIKDNSGNNKDQARADKRIKKLTKQLDETRQYDEALAYVASQNIEIDLDDGVKVNYAKFQNVEVSKEGQKVKKINLLKKI